MVLGDLLSFVPGEKDVRNGFLPLENGLMVFLKNQWAEFPWAYEGRSPSPKLCFPSRQQAASNSADSSLESHSHETDGKGCEKEVYVLFSPLGEEEMSRLWLYDQLPQHEKLWFSPDLAPTDENRSKVLGTKSHKSEDVTSLFQDHPKPSNAHNWWGEDIPVWRPIMVARAVFYGCERTRETAQGLKTLGELYHFFRLINPRNLRIDTCKGI
jgi:hypothetical protein